MKGSCKKEPTNVDTANPLWPDNSACVPVINQKVICPHYTCVCQTRLSEGSLSDELVKLFDGSKAGLACLRLMKNVFYASDRSIDF